MKRSHTSINNYKKAKYNRIENFTILYMTIMKLMPKPMVIRWLQTKKMERANIKRLRYSICITKDNRNLFTKLFGKHDFQITTEHRNFAWRFQMPNGYLIAFTGLQGTSYEFEGTPNDEDAKELQKLFDTIIEHAIPHLH